MALFSYKAMNSGGRMVHGQLDAINLVDLEMRLRRMELDFINGNEVRRSGLFSGGAIPKRELINFCFHMEQLTRAGVPILDGLTDLRDSLFHPRFREVIASMIESIEGGRTFSQAMGEHPKVFNKVFSSLILAGENTGNLPEVLRSLSESLKWEDELASHTKKLFMYPAFVGTVVLGVTFFLMIYLVPQMAGFIKNMGQALPTQTKILIATSAFVKQFWYLFLIVPALVVVGIKLAVEPLNRFECHALNTIADAASVAQRVGMPNYGVLYDTFHANIEEKDPIAAITGHLGMINHVHVSENDRGTPGKGHVPFAAVFRAFKAGGYEGWYVVEAFGRALPALAAATRVWRDFFPNREEVYRSGHDFLRDAWAKA